MLYPNLFQRFEKVGGRAWLRNIPREDRQVFALIGLLALGRSKFAYLGGKARAKTAKRDTKGRFLKNEHGARELHCDETMTDEEFEAWWHEHLD